MGADSCPRVNVVNVVSLRYAPVNQAGRAKGAGAQLPCSYRCPCRAFILSVESLPFYRGRFRGCMRFTVARTLHAMGFALEVVTLWAGYCWHGVRYQGKGVQELLTAAKTLSTENGFLFTLYTQTH